MKQIARPFSALRRIAVRVFSLSLTLAVIGAAGFAVSTGVNLLADRANATPPPPAAERIPVTVTSIEMENGYSVQRRFVGQIEARHSVALSFELGGRLTELLVDEGETVTKGQLLARLDTDLLNAERDQLQASRAALMARLEFAERTVERNSSLSERGFASQERLDEALAARDELTARIAETDAALTSTEIRLAKSELFAPFDGRVGQRPVDGAETLGAGQTVMTLIETADPQFRVGLPLSVNPADVATARVEVGGQSFQVALLQVRPDIDPVTRTRTAIFSVQSDQAATFGRTAALIVDRQVPERGAWVPLDAIQEGTGSLWTVLVVDGAETVRTAAVEVIHTEADRVFVRGTFEPGAQLVRDGAHRVTPGQSVRLTDGG